MKQTSALIQSLTDAGKIIFIVSHDLDLLMNTCDEVLVVEHGCVAKQYFLNEDTVDNLANWFQSLYTVEQT